MTKKYYIMDTLKRFSIFEDEIKIHTFIIWLKEISSQHVLKKMPAQEGN